MNVNTYRFLNWLAPIFTRMKMNERFKWFRITRQRIRGACRNTSVDMLSVAVSRISLLIKGLLSKEMKPACLLSVKEICLNSTMNF